MAYRQHNLKFQFQEASDTEMTPPCPTQERSNPFDDLAPPGLATSWDTKSIAEGIERGGSEYSGLGGFDQQYSPGGTIHNFHVNNLNENRGKNGLSGISEEHLFNYGMNQPSTPSYHQKLPALLPAQKLGQVRQDLIDSFRAFSFGATPSPMGTPPSTPTPSPGGRYLKEQTNYMKSLNKSKSGGNGQLGKPADLFDPVRLTNQRPSLGSSQSTKAPKAVHQNSENKLNPIRYKIPPPIALRLQKDDRSMALKKIESGQGLMALPSPVFKTLRGEANGYPTNGESPRSKYLPDSPAKTDALRDAVHDAVMVDAGQRSKFNPLKRLPTPPHSPGPNRKMYMSNELLSPPPILPMSPETPDRSKAFKPAEAYNPDRPDFVEDNGLQVQEEEEEEIFEGAQEELSKYPLDPAFLDLYEIKDEMGSGGFGFVCSAWSRVDQTEVAVKFIFKKKLHQIAMVKDWHRRESAPGILNKTTGNRNDMRLVPMEAAILQYVHHPGIVDFKALFEDDRFFYLVQELHGSPWSKNTRDSDLDSMDSYQSAMYSPSHLQPVQQSPGAMSSPSSCASLSSDYGIAPSPSIQSTFSDIDMPATPANLLRRGSAPGPSPPTRPPIMQRRSSHDLFECIEANDRFDEHKARFIFKQVVDCVSYLHRNGICHRDIKDENIVIDDKLHVKLIDFGSAVCYDVRYEPPYYDRFFGTLNFASSEILRGFPYQAAPAEVWSLGVLLSILLTGSPPFVTQKDAAKGRINLTHHVSRDAVSLMAKCMALDPRERYTIEQVKRHRWLAGEGQSRMPFGYNRSSRAQDHGDVVYGERPMLYSNRVPRK